MTLPSSALKFLCRDLWLWENFAMYQVANAVCSLPHFGVIAMHHLPLVRGELILGFIYLLFQEIQLKSPQIIVRHCVEVETLGRRNTNL